MKEAFREVNFRGDSLELIAHTEKVVRAYEADGLKLTLRQLYYQLVTQNIIKNEEKSYKRLGGLLSDARLSGLIDWGVIEDRGRRPLIWSDFTNISECCESAIDTYRKPRWNGQDHYVELWVEKDALSGVLRPLASEYHVTMSVNKGYSSQSAMYDASKRFHYFGAEEGKHSTLLYLGDHDPSGEDMVRDIQDRLNMFGVFVDVQKIALTTAQVEEYDPPPNPAKLTDSRAAEYIRRHGPYSWEVDALPPKELQQLIEEAILGIVDLELMDGIKDEEEVEKTKARKALANI